MTISHFVSDLIPLQEPEGSLTSLMWPDKRGNRVLIGITVMNIALYVITYFFYRQINRHREKKWNSMTPEVRHNFLSITVISVYRPYVCLQERQEYLDTTKDQGNEKLNFRFSY